MQKLTKFFEFEKREAQIHSKWDGLNVYAFNESDADTFSIDTPPPTVSGYLHMGHVFSYVQCDAVARYNRISGKNVFYPVGFDDNGLPTERLVEKQTGKKVGVNATRQEFKDECFKVVDEVEEKFENLFKSIGISYDWGLRYQTISKKTEGIVLKSFADLFKKGLVYLKNAPVYWDIEDKTALAQADLEDKELESVEYYVPFKCGKTGKVVEVMTTRPELLVSCVAVLHHPDDERFRGIKKLKTPFFEEEVPFIEDDTVKQEKGTGVVMCSCYGDWHDVDWVKKHSLKPKVLMKDNGEIAHEFFKNEETGRFLRVVNARKRIVGEMKERGLVLSEKKIMHSVKCGERSGKPVEIINQRQVYVRVLPFKNLLLEKIEELEFMPSYMKIRLQKWIEGLNQDWCISRNRFFGIEMPYYTYEKDGQLVEFVFPQGIEASEGVKILQKTENGYLIDGSLEKFVISGTVPRKAPVEVNFHYVFDTWFTSSLTPQIAKGSFDVQNLPFGMRPQAHEIIRTWTFYTFLKGVLHSLNKKDDGKKVAEVDGSLFFMNEELEQGKKFLPWKKVVLSGWCLASDKRKMSKSKGNVAEPLEVLKKFGSDVVRYWCCNTPFGTDSAYSVDRLELGQKFTTKFWNCAKFALQNEKLNLKEEFRPTNEVDLWILGELAFAVGEYEKHFDEFSYFHARKVLDSFFWNCFCDNYLEIIKVRYYGIKAFVYKDKNLSQNEIDEIEKGKNSAIWTVYLVMKVLGVVYSPFCPFICEEVSAILFGEEGSVSARGSLKEIEKLLVFEKQENVKWLEEVVRFRKCKQEGGEFTNEIALPKDVVNYFG